MRCLLCWRGAVEDENTQFFTRTKVRSMQRASGKERSCRTYAERGGGCHLLWHRMPCCWNLSVTHNDGRRSKLHREVQGGKIQKGSRLLLVLTASRRQATHPGPCRLFFWCRGFDFPSLFAIIFPQARLGLLILIWLKNPQLPGRLRNRNSALASFGVVSVADESTAT